MSGTELTAEQAASLAAIVSGRTPAAAPVDNTFERVWHPTAIIVGVLGVVGGVVMIRRAIITKVDEYNTSLSNVHWYNPFTWGKLKFF